MAQTKHWDATMRRLVRAYPESFTRWLVANSHYVKAYFDELESTKREVDALLEVIVNRMRMLLHIEFQTYNDATMADRLLEYNILARSKYKLPVLSCVIYLLRDGNVPQSPLIITIPGGQEIHRFHFLSIELGRLSSEDILSTNILGLFPLLPFTKGGTRRDVIARMQRELDQEPGLKLLGYTLAAFMLNRENKSELDWLIRSYRNMQDILRESPIYQEILREGLEQGIEQGRLETARNFLLDVVQDHFPALSTIAQKQASLINDPKVLRELTRKIGLAKTAEEAQGYLLNWDKKTYNA